MANKDPFDLEHLALTPKDVADLAPLQKKPPPAKLTSRTKFVKLPYEQTLALAGRLRDAPMAVLVELAYQAFKTHKNPVPLANAALRSVGIRRDAKLRALRQLEADELIAVEWRGRKSPLITILWE
jgi:hypothetical protein